MELEDQAQHTVLWSLGCSCPGFWGFLTIFLPSGSYGSRRAGMFVVLWGPPAWPLLGGGRWWRKAAVEHGRGGCPLAL